MMFQILISTVDDKFMLRKVNLELPYIVINQLVNTKISQYMDKNILSYNEKGLSKSRNRAIQYATADICLISDDDVEYDDDIKIIILKSFKKHPKADIITFQIQTPNGGLYKKYSSKSYWHNERTIMKVSSVEIAIKRKSVIDKNIQFDEDFGLGSKYPTGEEGIFLIDALRKGLNILYMPIPIVVHPTTGTEKNFINNIPLIEAKGAMFYRMFGSIGYFVSLLFAVKKYHLSNYSFSEFFNFMNNGAKLYKNGIENI